MQRERRLIEELLPVRAISHEATREKTLRRRDYHISMLHYWWARRPLAAARAAVYATLVPADDLTDDPEALRRRFEALCKWSGTMGAPVDAVKEAREEILAANGGEPPKILDCFAGGGAIPLEAARLGARAYAVELNPVAYLIDLCTLVYPQTYGPSLAKDVEYWGSWLVDRAREALSDLYPSLPGVANGEGTLDGIGGRQRNPLAYLWTRTVRCPNPALDPHDLHLLRQTWLRKKDGRYVALRPVVDRRRLTVEYEVVEAATREGLGFDPEGGSSRGSATCRVCGASVSADDVKEVGRSGKLGRHLLGAALTVAGRRGKVYVGSLEAAALVPDERTVESALKSTISRTALTPPEVPLPEKLTGGSCVIYGFNVVRDLFTNRQQNTLLTLCDLVRQAHSEMLGQGMEVDRARAVATYLGLVVDRVADRSSSMSYWDNSAEKTSSIFARQALPMVWDYSETSPFSGSSGDVQANVDQVVKVIRHCADTGDPAVLTRQSADEPVEGGPFDAVITDPPYYDNISYADLSNFYYAWLQRSLGFLYPEHLSAPRTPWRKEGTAVPYRHHGDPAAAKAFYDDLMAEVFAQRREELKPGAPLVVVYAHQTYAGWTTLISALRRAGFVIVEAWPLDTEMPTRAGAQNSASLASSIFLVARRREDDRVGDWVQDVQPQLKEIVARRVRELPDMGVGGDDLVIAAIGAGLRAYTAYARVELPNGEPLEPEQYLDEVQREVVEAILSDVFGLSRSGIAGVDPVTQFYVMGRFEFGTTWVDFDKANTLARGVGVELGGPGGLLDGRTALLEKDKSKVRLRDYSQRGKAEKLAEPAERGAPLPIIDVLHRVLALAPTQPLHVGPVVRSSGVDPAQLRLVAQALSGEALDRKGLGTTAGELTAIASLLAAWKRLVEAPRSDQLEMP